MTTSLAKPLTPRRERFAQLVAQGSTQADAYRQAGYSTDNMLPTTVHEEASRLASLPNVSARITELQQEAAIAAGLTVQRLMAAVNRNIDASVTGKHRPQYAASNGAIEIGARLIGAPGYDRQAGNSTINISVLAMQHVASLPQGTPLGPQAYRMQLMAQRAEEEGGTYWEHPDASA